jgi:hypothetical protein
VRPHGNQPLLAGSPAAAAAAAAAHPRLDSLKARYGARDDIIAGTSSAAGGAAGGGGGSALASSLVEVTLEVAPGAGGARPGKASARKRLPRSTTVGALKLLAERLFKVKAGRQALVLMSGGGEQDIGGDDTKPLAFWDPQVEGAARGVGPGEGLPNRRGQGLRALLAAANVAGRGWAPTLCPWQPAWGQLHAALPS